MLESIINGLLEALKIVVTFNPEVYWVLFLSLFVSGTAVLLSSLIGIPVGTYLGLRPVPGFHFLMKLIYTFMGLPPVLAGLVVYLLLSRAGPLGFMQILLTPTAMIIAQTILVLPIIVGLTVVGVRSKEEALHSQIISLGATERQAAWIILKESRPQIITAIVTGFGRAIAEVGAVIMVGGNISGYTRVLTTAIVLETRRENFEMAIALGIILMALSFIINFGLYKWQQEAVEK